jgi:formylglycine-generating enzyme required for sulfatase activity
MKCFILFCSILVIVPAVATADHTDQMVVVPAGVYIMGDGGAYCGTDERQVTLTRDFYLGQHEVTNQEYLEAVQWAYDHGYVTATTYWVLDNLDGCGVSLLNLDSDECEIQFDGAGTFYLRESPSSAAQGAYPGGYDPADHPVKAVNWFGSARYCDWLSLQAGLPRAYEHDGDWSCNGGDPYGAAGYRLPTDAEWEYAAQWDDERIYPWGDEPPDCLRVNFHPPGEYCVRWTSPVGSYPGAPTALGLFDMAGNVWELCNDWWVCNLGTGPVSDPTGPGTGEERVIRGGSWFNEGSLLRCAVRHYTPPNWYAGTKGFRVSRTVATSGVDTGALQDRSPLILGTNRPNPFTWRTRIDYSVPDSGAGSTVFLAIYDPSGRRVSTLVETVQKAGQHVVSWDGIDEMGNAVEAGAYLLRLTVGTRRETRQLLMIR